MARRRRQTVSVKDLVTRRRARLQSWITKHCNDNASAFARDVNKNQSYIADLLRGKKSFGEKAARDLEIRAKMPDGYLDSDSDDGDPRLMYHGILLTRAAALLAAEWEKLDLVDRIELEEEVRRRVQRKVVTDRERLTKNAAPNRDS